jgi:hypothetical protein
MYIVLLSLYQANGQENWALLCTLHISIHSDFLAKSYITYAGKKIDVRGNKLHLPDHCLSRYCNIN